MKVYDENKIRIKITNNCNSRCKFCLEGDDHEGGNLDEILIKKKIEDGFEDGMKNKLMLSGGEASTNINLPKYIKYGRKIGYYKIQTITNGMNWSDLDFCKKCVEAGLDEITFSIHGRNRQSHDYQTGIKGSFQKLVRAIYNFKTNFPGIIVNSDIVVSKYNIKNIKKIIRLLQKFDIYEYDMLQVIPFGNAWKNKDEFLFEDIMKHYDTFQDVWSLSKKDSRVYMWANRVDPRLLENHEEWIQSPEKIRDEAGGDSNVDRQNRFSLRKEFDCYDTIRCANCYLQDFCKQMINFFENEQYENKILSNIINNNKNVYKLYTHRSISKIDDFYPQNYKDFISFIKEKTKNYNILYNIPKCLIDKKNFYTNFLTYKGKKTYNTYIDWYEDEGFRIKSRSCSKCIFIDKCEGLHINLIKKYGFKILNPILKNEK